MEVFDIFRAVQSGFPVPDLFLDIFGKHRGHHDVEQQLNHDWLINAILKANRLCLESSLADLLCRFQCK